MVLNTGYVGLLLFASAIGLLAAHYWRTSAAASADAYPLRLALLTQTLLFVILMIESNPFVINVQTAAFMIAAYASLGVRRAVAVRKVQGAVYA